MGQHHRCRDVAVAASKRRGTVRNTRGSEAAVRSMVSYSEPASMAALGQCLSAPGTSKCKLQQFLSEARSSRGGSLNIKQVSVELLTES